MKRTHVYALAAAAAGLAGAALVLAQAPQLPAVQRPSVLLRQIPNRLAGQIRLQVPGPINTMTLVGMQMVGAGPGRVALLDEAGKVTKSFDTSVQRPSISPFGAEKILIGDLQNRALMSFDLKSGQSTPLLKLNEVTDPNPNAVPGGNMLAEGEFSSVAGDGKNVFVAVDAGFSSSIFKIDPVSKRIIGRAWATSGDPHEMVVHDGSLFVLVGGGSQIRRFSENLVKSHDHYDLPFAGGRGLGAKAGEFRTLTQGAGNVAKVAVQPTSMARVSLAANLDRVRLREGLKLTIKFPPLNLAKRYAVLICGDLAENFWGECFWNDTVWMYKTLIANGYNASDIIVLYGDGADYLSANPAYRHGSTVTDFAATTGNVNMVLDGLKNGNAVKGIPKMDANDTLFLWTFDHGGQSGGQATLCLRNGVIKANDFAAKANVIPYASRAIFMQQCYSGGFINPLKNNKTFISTACRSDEVARPADTENEVVGTKTYSHGEFNYHITTALNRLKPTPPGGAVNADANADTFIASKEMHNWNVSKESRPETPQSNDMGGIGSTFRFKK